MKDWEIIAGNLSKARWSWGCVSAINSKGRTIWIVDAHRDDGKRFVVHADEKLTAFMELGRTIRICTEMACQAGEIFGKKYRNQGLNPGEGASPDSFFPSFRRAEAQLTNRGNRKLCFMKTKTFHITDSINSL